MGPKKRLSYITGEGFKGSKNLTLGDIVKVAVLSFSSDHLSNIAEDWTGGVAGIAGLSLSNDNKRIIKVKLLLIGSLCKDKKIFANKYWDILELLSLVFTIADCSIFSFPNGGLVLEILDGSLIPYSFYKGDKPVPSGTLPDSILGFSIKCYVTFAKLNILLFPLPKDMLLSLHNLTTNPIFPGISLFTVEFPLIHKSSNLPLEKQWGFPFAPANSRVLFLTSLRTSPRSP